MRRTRWIGVLGVLGILAIPFVFVAGIYATHPRNEGRFIAQLNNTDFPHVWNSFLADHDNAFFLKEGDRACAWLRQQPIAFVRTSSKYQLGNVMDRYLAQTKQDVDWDMGSTDFAARRVVAVSAWNNLCEGTLLLHQPYTPW
jgi:hypothetical protein